MGHQQTDRRRDERVGEQVDAPSRRPPARRLLSLLVALALVGLVLASGPTTSQAWAEPPVPGDTGWPLDGTPEVVEGFDPPDVAWGAGHRGVDLAARPGDVVRAAAAGVVVFAGRVAGKPVVVVSHGALRTTYEPVLASVRVGQRVSAGQPIGRLGPDSHCPAGCLHWGLKRGDTYLDPLSLVPSLDGSAQDVGRLRLVAGDRRAVVVREAAARAAAAAAATLVGQGVLGPLGPAGSHGFAHPVPGAITSPYGMRFHPVLHRWKLHDGTDFGASCGTPIRAPYAGRVSRAYANAGYGNRLFLDHGTVDGRHVETAYNHAIRYVVRPGQRVERGQLLGYVGTTGFSTGCHLHLMIWLDGRMVDPTSWL